MASERNAEILTMRQVGHSLAAIAHKFDLSTQRVQQICARAGLSIPSNWPVVKWSEDEDAYLAALWAEGRLTREIANKLGRTRNSIIGRANRLKLSPRPSPIRRLR